jgi:hypothetical protein
MKSVVDVWDRLIDFILSLSGGICRECLVTCTIPVQASAMQPLKYLVAWLRPTDTPLAKLNRNTGVVCFRGAWLGLRSPHLPTWVHASSPPTPIFD